jgi:hypothetical protein
VVIMSVAACLPVPHDVPVRDTVNGWGIRDSPGPIRPRAGERASLRTPKQARSNVTTPTAWTVGIAELEIHNSERCRKGIPLRDTAEGFATPQARAHNDAGPSPGGPKPLPAIRRSPSGAVHRRRWSGVTGGGARRAADRRDSWRVVELSLARAELVIRYLVVWRRAQGDPVS